MGSDLKTIGLVGLPNYCNINYNLYHIHNFVAQGRAPHPFRVPSLDALSCITFQDRSVILFSLLLSLIPLECHPEKKYTKKSRL